MTTEPVSANGVRGERLITLGGRKWKLVPSHEALCAIEERLGVKSMPFFTQIAMGNVGVRDLIVIVGELMRAGGAQGIKDKMIGDMILEAGLGNAVMLSSITACLNDAMEGGAKNDPGVVAQGEAAAAKPTS
jgi:hypothetical protein